MKYIPGFINHWPAFQKCNEVLFLSTQSTTRTLLNTNKDTPPDDDDGDDNGTIAKIY